MQVVTNYKDWYFQLLSHTYHIRKEAKPQTLKQLLKKRKKEIHSHTMGLSVCLRLCACPNVMSTEGRGWACAGVVDWVMSSADILKF